MRIQLISALAAATALTGCLSVLPEPEAPDALYRIEAARDLSGLTQDLIIREPEAPRLMAGQGIVSEASDGALRLIPGVEWSGSATRQIQLAMIDSFTVGESGNALLPELGVIAPYEMASQLKALNLKGNRAVCTMTASVVATQGRQLVARSEISSQANAASNSGRDRALALREAASDCAVQAAEFAIGVIPAAD
ncbi:MAG: ABC-type transport auxiliary lipoprotein family protein [Pseudomonadota bacterium]